MQAEKIFQPQFMPAAEAQDALDTFRSQAGDPQEQVARRFVQVNREEGAVAQGPGELGIDR